MEFKNKISTEIKSHSAFKKGGWQRLGLVASTSLLMATFLSPANAVVFFKDDFERTSLDKSVGSWGSNIQDQLSNGADLYKTTRVWTAAAGGLELQVNGVNGFNAKSGKYRVELDTTANSSMFTKVNLVNGQSYNLKFSHRSIPKTTTTTTRVCTLIIFCQNVTTTSTTYVGGGLRAFIEAPGFSTGYLNVGDAANWTDASFNFTYSGPSGEAKLTFEATGASDSFGTSLDDIYLQTNIAGSVEGIEKAEALTGILPPHVPGLLSNDPTRTDIITPVVVDKKAAIALGKALFWEQGVGSDQMACASCHFHAGADNRIKNQMDPGINHATASGSTFENTVSGKKSGPNYTLTFADFPFNPSSDDVASSSGTFSGAYQTSLDGTNYDECSRAVGNIFHVNGIGTRNVEPRNTPTTINSAYNFRNFWDGRANNVFNGVSPFGLRDSGAGVFINTVNGLSKQKLKLRNASLASQAVGPVGSDFEMACRGRQFADVGRKLLNRKPLALQTIAANDSVLASLATMIGPSGTYSNLIQKAFAPQYWNANCGTSCGSPAPGVSPSSSYNQMEANFSLYFGIAVQMYEETLVSDDSRFDKWKRGLVSATASESNGESIFNGKGECSACHTGPTLTSAAKLQKNGNLIEGMLMKNNRYAIYDSGFYNLGVVPTDYDIGGDGKDPFGNTLTFTRQYISNNFVDSFGVEPCKFELDQGLCSDSSAARRAQQSAAVTGTFKVPTLRNVTLTGPYMHNGSLATLEQVVDFYNRGGNFDNVDKHPDIKPLGLSAQEKADLVAFLKTLTDDRVAFEKAPFDHPSLKVPNGHVGNELAVTGGNGLLASLGLDEVREIAAVGSSGRSQTIPTFVEGLAGVPAPSFGITANSTTLSIPLLSFSTSGVFVITPSNGFNSTVSFSVSGLPAGVSASFSPTTLIGSGSTRLTLSRLLFAGRQATLTISATSGGTTKTTNVLLNY
jgi:cytochrome c peroxidase